jgi:hypothetical protein
MMFCDIGAVGGACENATVKFGNAPGLERFKSEIASPLGRVFPGQAIDAVTGIRLWAFVFPLLERF